MLYTYKVEDRSLAWSFVPSARQTFYDPKHRLLTIKNGSTLEFMPMPDCQLTLPSSLSLRGEQDQDSIEELLALGYSLTFRSVCYQSTSKSLIIQSLLEPSKRAILNYDKLGQVLWFDWLRGSSDGNFFVVTNLAVQVLNFNEDRMTFKKVSAYKNKICSVWFDAKRQSLAINYGAEPTTISIYDLSKLDLVSWKYPTHKVLLDLTENNDIAKIQTGLNNHYTFLESRLDRPLTSHTIHLCSLYNEGHLLHMNTAAGKLFIHNLPTGKCVILKILSETLIKINIFDNSI
jgi:hypothetical protein